MEVLIVKLYQIGLPIKRMYHSSHYNLLYIQMRSIELYIDKRVSGYNLLNCLLILILLWSFTGLKYVSPISIKFLIS